MEKFSLILALIEAYWIYYCLELLIPCVGHDLSTCHGLIFNNSKEKGKIKNSSAKSNKKEVAGSRFQELGDKILFLDSFGEGVKFNIGDGKTTHKSYLGSLLTLIVIVITATYGFKRYKDMSNYEDTVVNTAIQKSCYERRTFATGRL